MSWSSPRARSRSGERARTAARPPQAGGSAGARRRSARLLLARAWSEVLSAARHHRRPSAGHARRHGGAASLSQRPLDHRHAPGMARVPVINENDTVATTEIRYGDNDRLAARVATMMSADLLVLLSDVDGLYDSAAGASAAGASSCRWSSASRRRSRRWPASPASELSRGGMVTKIEAGKIATTAGTHMVIASRRVAIRCSASPKGAALHLVPDAGQSGHRAQEMDCRLARAERGAADRCGRGAGAARRQKPAAGRRGRVEGSVRARRRSRYRRPGRRGDRPRPGCL